MIIQCDKCQSKFKLDDSKITPEGVKVKCKKCANIFVVLPQPVEKQEILIPTAPESSSPDFETNDKKEEVAAPSGAGEFSWDQFSLDSGGEKEEKTEVKSEEKQEKGDELSFDFEQEFGKQDVPAVEEKKEESSGSDFEFDFDKFEVQTKSDDEVTEADTEKIQGEKTLEEFVDEPASQKEEPSVEFTFQAEEPVTIAATTVESNKDEGIGEVKEEQRLDLPTFEFDFSTTEEEKKSEIEPKKQENQDFQDFVFDDEPKPEADVNDKTNMPEDIVETSSATKEEAVSVQDDLSFTFQQPQDKDFAFEETKSAEAVPEPNPAEVLVQEPKPTANWMVYIVSILVVIIFSGGGIAALWWQKAKILEKEGNLGISNIRTEYYESKTLDKVFVVTGKITNAHKVPKSFLRVKCVIYGKDNKKLSEKMVYAGNAFSISEIKELTYAEIEKGLNNKMGKSMMNVDVPPGKYLSFMIVFDKQPEDAVTLEVEAL